MARRRLGQDLAAEMRSPHRGAVPLVAGIGLILLGIGPAKPLLIFNATASAPIGFYRVLAPLPLRRGDLVLVNTPASIRALAAERHYLPATVPLVKRVAGLGGAWVCNWGGAIAIGGRHAADLLSADRQGRPLPAWTGCRRLASDEVFLLMLDVPESFDSRYFGPVPVTSIIGRLSPLWLR